eukprot:TRINITY_DN432_c0_g5_i1.p1 TRINITY_DN432_c0_g5~~TRINITY_DN432_c0_g5_i1.p1  ORF type:complete len:120 (-),score=38.56 TRINITY_DN432_c0_g5_i1:161-481(-)
MNILIKLTCLIGLVIAPILGGHANDIGLANIEEDFSIEMTIDSEDIEAVATVDYSTIKDGEKILKTIVFKGTKTQVENSLKTFEASLTNKAGEVEKVIEKIDITKG